MRRLTGRVFVLAVALALTAVAPLGAQEQPKTGGVLKAAMIGEPPTLDLHTTTAVIVQHITWHIYEGLYTYDRSYNPIPLLVESHTVSDKGRTYTFKLRRGVKFHNGKEMTSADVVASLTRWGRLATPGKQFWKNVEGVEAKDPLHRGDVPEGDIRRAPDGTGAAEQRRRHLSQGDRGRGRRQPGEGVHRHRALPLRRAQPDRHMKLARFKDYVARADAPDGFGGKRTAYLDEILFIPVPDVAVRLAGRRDGRVSLRPAARSRTSTIG